MPIPLVQLEMRRCVDSSVHSIATIHVLVHILFVGSIVTMIMLTRIFTAVVEDALEKLLLVSERSTKNRNALLVLDIVPVLIHLIKTSRYVELQAGAVKVLASLAIESRAQSAIRNANGIDPIVYLANHKPWLDDVESLAHVLLCLKRMTFDNENKTRLREANFTPDLVRIAHAVSAPAVKALALEVMAILTIEDAANQLSLWQTNMTVNYVLEVCYYYEVFSFSFSFF